MVFFILNLVVFAEGSTQAIPFGWLLLLSLLCFGVNLPLTPTNLHTHGLVVQARAATATDLTWGDDI